MLTIFQHGRKQIKEESKPLCFSRLDSAPAPGCAGAAGEESHSPAVVCLRSPRWHGWDTTRAAAFAWTEVPQWLPSPGEMRLCTTGRAGPGNAGKPGCLARGPPGLPGRPSALGRRRGARRTRGQRRWEAITSPLRPALIPSRGVRGAGSPNKAQSG